MHYASELGGFEHVTGLWKNAEEEPPPPGSHVTWSADERLRRQQTKSLLQSEYFLYTQVTTFIRTSILFSPFMHVSLGE